ncbi:MAG: HPr family phosphocarrier protein [Verrucomicrobiales bacterium]|nr:HPr family phosphocarrier protein [Verrucomicrobiales bacterium]
MGGRSGSNSPSICRELVVANRLGIHARPAAMFVRIASRFQSEIVVEKDGERINGKSIMGLMMLAAGPGSRLRLHANGDDADDAVRALEELILVRKFDEE